MPIALIIIGILMIVVGARGTHKEFGALLVGDFTGPGNFTYWLAAIGIVGAIGYNETMRPFSRMFLALIIVAMLLSNRGFFAKLDEALRAGPANIPSPNQDRAANDNKVNVSIGSEGVKVAGNFATKIAGFAARIGFG